MTVACPKSSQNIQKPCKLIRIMTTWHNDYMSYSLHSLRLGYIGDFTGDYYRGY